MSRLYTAPNLFPQKSIPLLLLQLNLELRGLQKGKLSVDKIAKFNQGQLNNIPFSGALSLRSISFRGDPRTSCRSRPACLSPSWRRPEPRCSHCSAYNPRSPCWAPLVAFGTEPFSFSLHSWVLSRLIRPLLKSVHYFGKLTDMSHLNFTVASRHELPLLAPLSFSNLSQKIRKLSSEIAGMCKLWVTWISCLTLTVNIAAPSA